VHRVLQALDERLEVIEARLKRRDPAITRVTAGLIEMARRVLRGPRGAVQPPPLDHPREQPPPTAIATPLLRHLVDALRRYVARTLVARGPLFPASVS
jgi:hypothetical protein